MVFCKLPSAAPAFLGFYLGEYFQPWSGYAPSCGVGDNMIMYGYTSEWVHSTPECVVVVVCPD